MDDELKTKIALEICSLGELKDPHLKILEQILRADNGNIWGVDLVVKAVIQRSLSVIAGFETLANQDNVLCAGALLRLQVDNILRLYACWLVKSPHDLALEMIQGKPLRKSKSRDGIPLTDKYLCEQASRLYPWILDVYNKTSGFVHLSSPHMLLTISSINECERSIETAISVNGPKWPLEEKLLACQAFCEATKSLLHLCISWKVTKSGEAGGGKKEPPVSG